MPVNFDKELLDNFQAISTLLALAVVLFGLQYQKILDAVRTSIPEGPLARAGVRRVFLDTLWYGTLPVALVSGGATYLLLPATTYIILNCHLSLWTFDFLRSAWFLVFLLLAAVFIWSVLQMVALFRCARRAIGH
jgi:hypothetical protein